MFDRIDIKALFIKAKIASFGVLNIT